MGCAADWTGTAPEWTNPSDRTIVYFHETHVGAAAEPQKEVTTMTFLDDAHAMSGDLVRLREDLHREPEIGLHLPRTQEKVLAALEGLPLEITLGAATTSVTAVLRGTGPATGRATDAAGGTTGAGPGAPVVLLRGDMDALPVAEATGLPFASQVEGRMHACGHDLHTTMLIGAARLLSERRHELDGDVVFMFQPGEEGYDGAGVMIREGVLDATGRRADAAFALHVFSALVPGGHFLTRAGTFLSASDELHVTVLGQGGHGSTPDRSKDPVPAVAEMVSALQTMVTRRFSIFDPVVVTVGLLQAGTKANVIPDTAMFHATVRTFSPASRATMMDAAPRLLRGIAAAHDLDVDIEYVEQYPVTVNDAAQTRFVEETVSELFGEERLVVMPSPIAGSEDFSRVLAEVPGSFIGLSAVPVDRDPESAAFNHSPLALFDSAVLPDGTALYAELAHRRLAALARPV